jgi:hypothetical protein
MIREFSRNFMPNSYKGISRMSLVDPVGLIRWERCVNNEILPPYDRELPPLHKEPD